MTVGILMEKPSAARNGAAALGGSAGTYNGEKYVIASARGHLYEYVSPHTMVEPSLRERYEKWGLANLPWNPADMNWHLAPIKDTGQVRKDIQAKLGSCDEIVIATDDDPTGEGDAIAIRAIQELGLDKPGRTFSRMYFTDESPASLQKAFTSRKPVPSLRQHPAFKMADFRSAWDLLSMQWSRAATIMARESGVDTVLRQGRLKSAMVKLVGDQLKAHNDYVRKPFFQNRFRDDHDVVYINPEEPRFDQKDQVPPSYSSSAVVMDSKTDKATAPPKLLDLASLSSLLVGKGIKAKTVLSTYQKMYEAQVVSYPRTEDKTITPEQFKELSPLVDKIAAVVGVDPGLLTHRSARSTHVKPKGAHGANRPGPKVPASLSSLSQYGPGAAEIYAALAKNYLAMLADDYRYEQQKGHVEAYPEFVGLTNVPKSLGWKQVFDADASDPGVAEDGEASENSRGLGTTADPFVFEGSNKRPEHPSMKWLMKQLEKRDVGTGATRTSTYSEVTSTTTKYPLLVEQGRRLTLAQAGEMSWHLLPDTHIGDLGLTEKVYADMRAIAEGTGNRDELLAVLADWVVEDIARMQTNAATMRSDMGLSHSPVSRKERCEGVWAKTGASVAFSREWGGHRFTDDEVARLLAGETIEVRATSSNGKEYDVYGELAKQNYKGRTFMGFAKLGFGRRDASGQALPPNSWCNHVFTPDEVRTLMAGGKVTASDFVGKSKKSFSCDVSFVEEKPGEGKKIVPDFGTAASSNEPPRSWCGKTFTDAERKQLAAGKTIEGKGFTSAKGKQFDAKLTWKDEGGRKKIVPLFG